MKTIKISKPFTYLGLEIPGGWEAEIPTVTISFKDRKLLAYAREFQVLGLPPGKALDRALAETQKICENGILAAIRRSVGHYAKMYERAFGDLEGFDATEIARRYAPGGDGALRGRRGKPTLRPLLVEMRRNV